MTTLVPDSDAPSLKQRLAATAQQGPRPHSRWDLVCASGALRSLAWSTVRLSDRDGSYAGLLSIGEDLTERLVVERNLERTRREMEHLGRATVLGELVSGLAHELNQPLTAILSNAQAARRFMASGRPVPQEMREILDDIIQADKHAADVIQRLRLMLRKGEAERECFRIGEPFREVLGLLRIELEGQGISVREALDPTLPPVEADRVEAQQVIMNLLINAAHALSKSPSELRQIYIRAERLDGEEAAVVSIEDKGPGISPDALERAFEPFYTTRSGGLGMGLAICRRIVEAHGGRIWGENTDSGARFSFTLPFAAAEPPDD